MDKKELGTAQMDNANIGNSNIGNSNIGNSNTSNSNTSNSNTSNSDIDSARIDKEIDLLKSNYGTTHNLDYQMVVLPWGATEPHNYHLPYMTDAILSHDVSVEAARIALEKYGIRTMVLPPVFYGSQNPGQRDLKFCIHGSYQTQKSILKDVAHSLYEQGFRRLLIVNGHGGNSFKNMIRDMAVELPDMVIAVTNWYNALPVKDYFDLPGDHADEIETSAMMYYHPELVNLDEAGEGKGGGFESPLLARGVAWIPRNWQKVSKDTGVGTPRLSTPEKGRHYCQDVASLFADLIRDLTAENLYKPLE